MTRMSMKS